MRKPSIRKVKSADRTIDLLETLAQAAEPLSAAEISAALGIPKSSLFHLLGTLEDRGYLAAVAERGYSLGPAIARLARASAGEPQLVPLIERVLDDLREAINESCGFSVQKGDDVEVVATRVGRNALTYTMQVGDLAPLYAVSGGKILLAQKDRDWLNAYLERVRFERFTPNTIQSRERLLKDIERARAEAFGLVEEEFTPGIMGLGAVVRQRGEPVGAINVAIPSPRFNAQKASLVRQHLRRAVSRAENLLG